MNPNISIDEDVSINIDHIEKNRNWKTFRDKDWFET